MPQTQSTDILVHQRRDREQIITKQILHIEGWSQESSNSNIFLKSLYRGNVDPFVNNANLDAIAHTSNGT